MKKARQRITKKLVDALQPGETIWDTDIRGFGVRRQIHDKVFILKASAQGRRHYITIGKHGSPFTVEQARNEAVQQLALLKSGTASSLTKRRICTMREFCDRYLRDHALKYKKPTSVRSDRSLINCHILPLLGNDSIDRIDREKIEEFQNAVATGVTAPSNPIQARKLNKGGRTAKGGIGAANRAVALLSKFLNLAEDWNLRPQFSNPVHRLRRYKEKGRRRYLSSDEIVRIGNALTELEVGHQIDPFASAAIKLLIFTGARSSEITGLQWSFVDLDRHQLLLPDSKTGQKTIHLSTHAVEILRGVPRIVSSQFVFPGRKHQQPIVNLQKSWKRICVSASIIDARLHDLRHTFASFAAQQHPLTTIQGLLGHNSPQTTARYAHLSPQHLTTANEEICNRIGDLMTGVKNSGASR